MKIGGIVLAAGLSSRMEQFKPLLPYRGKTLIENAVSSLLQGGVDDIVVVTGKNANEVESVLNHYPIRTIRNDDYETSDMITSIKIGLQQLDSVDAVFILPGDIPKVEGSTVKKLISEFHKNIPVIYPSYHSVKGHPPLVSRKCFEEILCYQGNDGLREILATHKEEAKIIEIEDEGIVIDIDYPKDYQQLIKE